jgi:RNA polymerase sigma factor (sigma-70 family)
MTQSRLATAVRSIRQVLVDRAAEPPADRDLLREFAGRHDSGAFAAIVRRYGPLVLGICRRELRHEQDAEDAFQATFLVLARKAGSIRRGESLAAWLHGVSCRIAMKAKRTAARRRAREEQVRAQVASNPVSDLAWREVQAVLDEEVQRLPALYRGPFVLCCLEGVAHAETARRLGLKQGTVASRLAHARKLLQAALDRRGITLSTVLAALAVTGGARAAVPQVLAETAALAAPPFAAGASPGISARALSLAEEVLRTFVATRAKLGTALLLLCLLGSAGSVLAHRLAAANGAEAEQGATVGPQPPGQRSGGDADKRRAEALFEQKGDAVTVGSRVLGPDGKPFAGATVTVWWHSGTGWVLWHQSAMHTDRPRRVATSAADGNFRFSLSRAEMKGSLANSRPNPWDTVMVVASAKGHGPAWASVVDFAKKDLTLRLARDDVPITGRIRDLEGRPVASAAVRVTRIKLDDQDSWLDQNGWVGLPDKVTTGKDGCFTMTGVGRDRTVSLLVSGPGIETRVVTVSTRAAKRATVDLLVGPTKVIEGTVRARDTGKPLAGAWIYGSEWHYCNTHQVRAVRARTDERGRYRLVGLPKARSYEITVYPADEAAYLAIRRSVADPTADMTPLRFDWQLRRGVPVRCRLIDRETGRPVHGSMQYEVGKSNPLYPEAELGPGVIPSREFMRCRATDQTGTIRFIAYPGAGAIFARAGGGGPYLMARLDAADEARGHYPLEKGNPANGFVGLSNGYRRIDPDPAKDGELTFDIAFTRGRSVKGKLIGPDGKPVTGATAHGHAKKEGLASDTFTAAGLYPGEARTLSFVHAGHKLVGHVVVRGTEKGPLTVRMQPWGTLTGRLVDADGKPHSGVKVRLHYPTLPPPGMQPWDKPAETDRDGRFRVEGLLPGLRHELSLEGATVLDGKALKGLSTSAGEVKDVGTIRVKVTPAKKPAPASGSSPGD